MDTDGTLLLEQMGTVALNGTQRYYSGQFLRKLD